MNALLFCDLKKKYKKIQKLNIREKEVMFLHFPSLPCMLWLVSSLIISSDDFPAHRGKVGQATPSLTFLGGARWSRAASGTGAGGLGLRVLCHPKRSDPFSAVPGDEESRLAENRCEMGLPGGDGHRQICSAQPLKAGLAFSFLFGLGFF